MFAARPPPHKKVATSHAQPLSTAWQLRSIQGSASVKAGVGAGYSEPSASGRSSAVVLSREPSGGAQQCL